MTLIQHTGWQLAPHFYVLINYSSTNDDHDAVRDKKTKANVKVRICACDKGLDCAFADGIFFTLLFGVPILGADSTGGQGGSAARVLDRGL